jgi:hypothetical protein
MFNFVFLSRKLSKKFAKNQSIICPARGSRRTPYPRLARRTRRLTLRSTCRWRRSCRPVTDTGRVFELNARVCRRKKNFLTPRGCLWCARWSHTLSKLALSSSGAFTFFRQETDFPVAPNFANFVDVIAVVVVVAERLSNPRTKVSNPLRPSHVRLRRRHVQLASSSSSSLDPRPACNWLMYFIGSARKHNKLAWAQQGY